MTRQVKDREKKLRTGAAIRIATFDIETSNLAASYGRLLGACFKFDDEDFVWEIDALRYKDEPAALEAIFDLYEAADVVVTWNGKMFDLPFTNARLMKRRHEVRRKPILDPGKKHVDLMYMFKKLRTAGNRLSLCGAELQLARQKYDVDPEVWVRAIDGSRAALDEIMRHCHLDVLMTMDAVQALRDYIVRVTR